MVLDPFSLSEQHPHTFSPHLPVTNLSESTLITPVTFHFAIISTMACSHLRRSPECDTPDSVDRSRQAKQ